MSLFTVETDDRHVTTIKLNRPEIHNAFNEEVIFELTTFFQSLSDSGATRLIVLAGEGKSFCAGADLNWMKKMKDYSTEENVKDGQELRGLFEEMNNCHVPIIGKVHGAALGGGAGLVSVCDYVVAASNTKIGFTEVKLGLLPAVISPYVVAKIGHSQARAYFLSGEIFDAHKAYDLGLVHRVCEASELDQVVENQIDVFLKAAPHAAKEAKALCLKLKKLPATEVGDYTCQTIARIRVGEEGQEGMTALLEKRKPNWMEQSGD